MRRISLLERTARVARRLALRIVGRERDERPGSGALSALPESLPPQIPAGVRADGRDEIGVSDAARHVAIGVNAPDEDRVGRAVLRRKGAVLAQVQGIIRPRIPDVRDVREPRRGRRHEPTVGDGRKTARWRLDPLRDPFVQRHAECRPDLFQRERIAEVLTDAPVRRRSMDTAATAVLRPGDQVDAHVVRELDVGAERVGDNEGRPSLPELGFTIAVDDLRAGVRRGALLLESVRSAAERVGQGRVGERELVAREDVVLVLFLPPTGLRELVVRESLA